LGAGVTVGTETLSFYALGGAAAQASAAAAGAAASTSAATAAAATLAASSATASASTSFGVAIAAAAASSAAIAGGAILVGGNVEVTAQSIGCHGANKAIESVPRLTPEAIKASEKSDDQRYTDILLWPEGPDAEMKVLYVGDFAGKLTHGHGRLFWRDTQMECFIGEFSNGHILEGLFINEFGIPVGRLRKGESGGLVVTGFQPDSLFDPFEPCAICLEKPSILSEGSVLTPCMHGCVCASCLLDIHQCPMCREPVTGSARI